MFIRLSPAQSTGIHGWGSRLKTTLTWKDIEDHDDIDLDLLLQMELDPRELKRLNEDVGMWVRHAGCRPRHALHMLPWPAHPIHDLGGDLSDVIGLNATGPQLKAMGVTYEQMREAGMLADTMRLVGLSLHAWIDLGLTLEHSRNHFTDAQLSRLFGVTRGTVSALFRATAPPPPPIPTTTPPPPPHSRPPPRE